MPFTLPPPAAPTAERLLLEFEQTGDAAPFAEIVRRYSGMVYAVCYRVTRNAHDAEDATQATFLKLATAARTTTGVPRVGPWLQQVAKTTAVDLRRSRSRRQSREQVRAAIEQQQQGYDDATDTAGMDELKQLLRDEVDRLPVHYRTPLILYYFGGLSTEQIAVELKTNAKALAVRLFRGRKMLGTRLKDKGVVTAGGALVTLAVADAILGTLANAVWTIPGASAGGGAAVAGGWSGGGMAAGGWGAGGWAGTSGWATSHSAVCASIAERVVALTRVTAAGAFAGKWKLSVLVAVSAGTVLAGSSEAVRASAVVQKVGDILQDIGSAIRGIGRAPGGVRQTLPALRADASPPPAAPADKVANTKPAAPIVLARVPVGQPPLPPAEPRSRAVLAVVPAVGSAAAPAGPELAHPAGRPFGFGPAGAVTGGGRDPGRGEAGRPVAAIPALPPSPRAADAVLALSGASTGLAVADAKNAPAHEFMPAGGRSEVAVRRVAPVATSFQTGTPIFPLEEVPPHLRRAIVAATYGSNPPPAVLALLDPQASLDFQAAAQAAGTSPTGEQLAAFASAAFSPARTDAKPGGPADGTVVAGGAAAIAAGSAATSITGIAADPIGKTAAGWAGGAASTGLAATAMTGAFDGLTAGSKAYNPDAPPPQFVQPEPINSTGPPGPATAPAPGVPEPTASTLVAAGLLALAGRRRYRGSR